ncbi:hypothetical protein SLEP1_g5222 [Rubroshorea leprosula]|uniref:Uncharacterized protein n=1 Tax=Rubroshorea leprosula TaxID=152421 RepID=A0AAV5HX47_9ROSI|nr:hypothetical protein SLEP1_g5222 [Rubroshorea leprosula]
MKYLLDRPPSSISEYLMVPSLPWLAMRMTYNDGDPLSADDHSFVLDNVFAYHPEKGRKMGAGIDDFMISKHVNFPESRCLYVVTTDGFKEDFSYRKCLDNFVKGKYPDLAEEFIAKYFRKPRSGGNRDQNSVPPQTPQDENQQ